jgi:hypothetical protein
MTRYRIHFAYCSARDQRIRAVRRSEVLELPERGDPDPDPSDVVCLEFGSACTGAVCPLFEVPSAEMASRLVAAGLMPVTGP